MTEVQERVVDAVKTDTDLVGSVTYREFWVVVD